MLDDLLQDLMRTVEQRHGSVRAFERDLILQLLHDRLQWCVFGVIICVLVLRFCGGRSVRLFEQSLSIFPANLALAVAGYIILASFIFMGELYFLCHMFSTTSVLNRIEISFPGSRDSHVVILSHGTRFERL